MASPERPAADAAAAQPSSSPAALPLPTPPSIDEALSYWIGLSQLIGSVAVPSRANGSLESSTAVVFTRYTLQGILLFCGIKQHRLQQRVDHMIAQMLAATSASPPSMTTRTTTAPSSSPFLLLVDNDAAHGGPAQPASLSLLIRDWLLMSLDDASPCTTASPHHLHPSRRYQLHVPAAAWERTIIKALGNELRGQMICLRPLLRWNTACAQQCGQTPVVVLIGGTSGSGKSTLARLVASQLRIANVLSTDIVRQVLRARLASRAPDYPTLFVSTYEAYKAVAANASDACPQDVVAAYESQCELVLQVLDGMLKRLLARRESVVIEGVHLLPKYLTSKRAELLVDRVICVPVLVQIPKASGHLERFCVRSRGMSLQSDNNKYIASFQAIRTIQSHLVSTVEEAAMPVLVLTNTNVDKSFLVLHHAVLETMEHTALNGWPADPAAAAQVPLTPLAFTATKRRLVAVVRQRRTHRGTAGAVAESGGNGGGGVERGAAAVRDGRGGAPVEDVAGSGEDTPLSADTRAAPPRRLPLEVFGAEGGAPNGLAFPAGVAGAVAASSRARSAELLSTMQRRLLDRDLLYSSRHADAVHAHADPVPSRPTAQAKAAISPVGALPSSSSPIPVSRRPAPPSSTVTHGTDSNQLSCASVVDGGGSPFRAAAPRRSTTTSLIQPSSFSAFPSSKVGEEVFDELEMPSLMGS
ncbi:hypothetical protein ABB37_06937 [Leptomonas pyrrhocoris]|uniref:Zeta toxin domain-containing protein n=1 Tax=Leptomonas pyrrhocoris TaxID=157538 RepID=A0A0N0DTJ4_LEPPY|nr:hypothetical protein ABB37_06937 [Leptomonas pyrrhocoris]XP_015656003.1 hypothetical protein ABB37_06937 [Leptomonas pyrrhocoris]KPA77563.1 hypothetical protein ABB37_06937 [Leptomonas pyrrhocoris]KPA77564.1 hypothetical protein ABB37_06937 [Leptomonas pyrrhocoris]|eukprot:XP_015656002.1 hypothetical protein ABB37_06937 [Leptomonas pyrrhocoris]